MQYTSGYRAAIIVLMLLAVVGFADSTYLVAEHYQGDDPVCALGPVGGIFDGCGTVTGSKYATVLGIPVALGGMAYYLLAFVLALVLLRTHDRRLLASLFALVTVALLVSLWFVYLQFFVLNALCLYCMISALTTALLFFVILGVFLVSRRNPIGETPPSL